VAQWKVTSTFRPFVSQAVVFTTGSLGLGDVAVQALVANRNAASAIAILRKSITLRVSGCVLSCMHGKILYHKVVRWAGSGRSPPWWLPLSVTVPAGVVVRGEDRRGDFLSPTVDVNRDVDVAWVDVAWVDLLEVAGDLWLDGVAHCVAAYLTDFLNGTEVNRLVAAGLVPDLHLAPLASFLVAEIDDIEAQAVLVVQLLTRILMRGASDEL